jgi:uncharacterized protein (TIGR00290 family)
MKAFVSWSGGKDTSLASYRARQKNDIKIACLLNMVSEDGSRSRSHGITGALLRAQASAIGVPIVQPRVGWTNYEEEFKKALTQFKKEGIEAGVFGDIDVREHRDWVERVCKEMEIKPLLPLWKKKREALLREFLAAGFKTIVVAVQADKLAKEWLGRQINEEFIEDLKKLDSVDLCGERGEYHTFVFDGPIFQSPVKFTFGRKTFREKRWFLELIGDREFGIE